MPTTVDKKDQRDEASRDVIEKDRHDRASADQDHTTHEDDDQSDDRAHTDHSGHENMFRRRFWVSLVLSIPVVNVIH